MSERFAWTNTANANTEALTSAQSMRTSAPSEGDVLVGDAPMIDENAPITLDCLYFPGPQSETFMFWGVARLSGLALYQFPAGNIIYYTVPAGKVGRPRRVQIVNTSDQDVTASFRFGADAINDPRLQSDILVPANGEYDLSLDVDCSAGEQMALIVDMDRALIVAITGHLEDAA